MDQSHQSGFSLFPMPPTPPADKQRVMRLLREQQQIANENVPKHLLAPAGQAPPPPIPAQLRPAPLKLRKKRPAQLNHTHPRPTLRVINPDPQSSESSTSWPTLPVQDNWPAPKDAEYQPPLKRRSHRASQWLGPNGQVDRKKLSVYLSKVLDSSFQNDQPYVRPSALPTPVSEDSIIASKQRQPRYPGSCHVQAQCACPPGVALCHSCSSEEFEQFRRRQIEHKSNPSVSSTKCIMSVPRARFRGTLADVVEPEPPSSPPELMYDSEESEESDWSSPTISSDTNTSAPSVPVTPTPAPRKNAVPRQNAVSRPNVPSFSLPFTHGRQITPRIVRDSTNCMSGDPFASSPASTVPTLASISTISTFAFDFSEKDDETEYDPFEQGSELSEIRTYQPIQKAKPLLVHCRGPSPQSIKYGHAYSYRSNRSPRSYQVSEDSGYSTFRI
ncbi:uncharacterized protein A1O9_04207 [Exophiala aquamarina CBS 119918]|uniref:Uncharacterized protein n=1 Tax=Exophiala aquamarina CBS 119918 TaxID=1182545 RepID=A0A072PJ83_9EURO|nr:uncharacterized protein A1O9_04207 [Exophiala aquamarina CBS 119918]KEF59363.1 hypothetical protein A1O9_04207 [Exophiala aquamarina CBS 119918]